MKITLLSCLLLLTGCAHEISESRPLILDERSTNLTADIKAMWKTQRLKKSSPDLVSTEAAVEAADRVFSTVQLVGMTETQVFALLGNPALSSQSIYHTASIAGAPKDSVVYRFDTGFNGWEFLLIFDHSATVRKVRRFAVD